jgi:hypothetical protein
MEKFGTKATEISQLPKLFKKGKTYQNKEYF